MTIVTYFWLIIIQIDIQIIPHLTYSEYIQVSITFMTSEIFKKINLKKCLTLLVNCFMKWNP